MDNEILEILKRLENKFDANTNEIKSINTKINRIEKKLDVFTNQITDLIEFSKDNVNYKIIASDAGYFFQRICFSDTLKKL